LNRRVYTLAELSELVRGRLAGDGGIVISGVAAIKDAVPGEITLFADAKYKDYLKSTRASAVIRRVDSECEHPSIVTDEPYIAFVKILGLFSRTTDAEVSPGRHESAVIDSTAQIAADASIGPFCRIGQEARVGARTRILFGSFIGDRVAIGEDCLIFPNVTIREGCEIGDRVILHAGVVIGADGFGYQWDGKRHVKVPQIGKVVVEDDVEIGANSAVDRATTGITRVGRGTKIDNLVQVGHNCVIGKNSILAGQVGLAGSTILGEGVIVGGQAGFMGHIEIGDRVSIAAQAGVTHSLPAGMAVSGYPAREHRLARRIYAYTTRLPELFKRVKAIEAVVGAKKKRRADGKTANDDC
jgi:UDP-3-O-[3-hydroxymyristoyl] glucosamine N-acyltransferase